MWRRIRDSILNNWRLKFLAVLSAALCFQGIRSATNARAFYEIPVEVELEKGMAVHSRDPMMIKVHFQGAREDLRWLDKTILKAVVRPSGLQASDGAETVAVFPRDIQGHPATVRVVKIEPALVNLTLDQEVEKLVDVAAPLVTGTPMVGKVELKYEPHVATVRGPKRRLETAEFDVVNTEPVNVDGKVASFSRRVKVFYPADWVSQVEPSEVVVNVNIVQQSAVRKWTNVTVMAVIEPGAVTGAYFDPTGVKLSVRGRVELVDAVTRDSARVFVDCRGLDPSGTYELPVNVHLRDPELKATVEPDTVRVLFRTSK